MKFRFVAALLVAGLSFPAVAHHSAHVYDTDNLVELKGAVKEFQWQNPHSWIIMDVQKEDGTVEEWVLEMNSIPRLRVNGFTSGSMVPGDEITATVGPLKDGRQAGRAEKVMKADGTVLIAQ